LVGSGANLAARPTESKTIFVPQFGIGFAKATPKGEPRSPLSASCGRLDSGVEGLFSFRIHDSWLQGGLNRDLKRGTPSPEVAVARSRDPDASRRLPRTPFLGSLHDCWWEWVYQAQSCLGHAEGCFRRLQTQILPFATLAFQRGREAETRTAAEPCAPESEGTFRVRRPGTIAMVSGMATSLVGRQSTVRASPDGSGLTGADGPPSQH
jgi:hypothetical protein